MSKIQSAAESFRELLDTGCAVPGSARLILVHTAEYGEALAILMLEDEKRISELSSFHRPPTEFKHGFFVVNQVGLVIVMLSVAQDWESLGCNVTELWINHHDRSQGPEASLLTRLAAGCP